MTNVLFSILCLPLAAAVASQALNDVQQLAPVARSRPAAQPSAIPALPEPASALNPLTLEITIRRQRPGRKDDVVTHTVTRTADRIHFSASGGREWLFEQNSVDRRRVAGYLIDHRSRAIVIHAESDLRMLVGIRGWADVVALGLDLSAIDHYQPTKAVSRSGGVVFTRYTSTTEGTMPSGIWWSPEHLLAQEFMTRDGNVTSRTTIVRITPGADPKVLNAAESRFPAYRLVDVSDWLEHR